MTEETVEATFVQAILNDSAFAEVEDRFFAASSLGVGPNPEQPAFPWMAWIELSSWSYEQVRETSNAKRRSFTVSVYDEMGDFTKINTLLRGIERVVKTLAPFTTTDGTRCSDCRVSGFSGDITDPEYDASVRFLTVHFDVSQ